MANKKNEKDETAEQVPEGSTPAMQRVLTAEMPGSVVDYDEARRKTADATKRINERRIASGIAPAEPGTLGPAEAALVGATAGPRPTGTAGTASTGTATAGGASTGPGTAPGAETGATGATGATGTAGTGGA